MNRFARGRGIVFKSTSGELWGGSVERYQERGSAVETRILGNRGRIRFWEDK